ncbi:ostA-like family protein [Lyngbya aestuarii BL J]|uniref:OstA-like family protein n=1 Tax=Lyngbya aestuarii BL J TaxID=1348334 RepID=U7QFB0_9CYAN|nr:LptA/OstA family protein [Lyngbya aestuarii]ERT05932.1 ostA-like family protein [Lyngbya aestuarii BL J]
MYPAKLLNLTILRLLIALLLPSAIGGVIVAENFFNPSVSKAQSAPPAKQDPATAMTVRSDIQEADANTGIVTARGNVQINYPARNIQATAAQAQYFSREGRIVLSGDVYILQEGSSIRGETVTYLIEEGRFVALPAGGQQVESIYIVPDDSSSTKNAAVEPFNPKPAFKNPFSAPPAR